MERVANRAATSHQISNQVTLGHSEEEIIDHLQE